MAVGPRLEALSYLIQPGLDHLIMLCHDRAMNIASAFRMMVPDLTPGKRNLVNELITTFFWACFLLAPLFLVMAFNEEIDRRTVARSTPTDAVVNRLFHAQTRGHPLYLAIGYYKDPPSSVICNVDVLLQANPTGLSVGKTIKIVRTSSDCSAPLLVDYLASPIKTIKFTIMIAILALLLFLIQLLRTHGSRTQKRGG